MLDDLQISRNVILPHSDYTWKAVAAQGPGGQHVNKTSTAIILTFPIMPSSLPDSHKQALLKKYENRLSNGDCLVIRSEKHRSQLKNRQDVCDKLVAMIKQAIKPQKKRRPTKPTKSSKAKRVDKKKKHSGKKEMRRKISY